MTSWSSTLSAFFARMRIRSPNFTSSSKSQGHSHPSYRDGHSGSSTAQRALDPAVSGHRPRHRPCIRQSPLATVQEKDGTNTSSDIGTPRCCQRQTFWPTIPFPAGATARPARRATVMVVPTRTVAGAAGPLAPSVRIPPEVLRSHGLTLVERTVRDLIKGISHDSGQR